MKYRERNVGDVRHRKEEWWRTTEGRKLQQSSSNAVTFFFSNLLATYEEYDMVKIFQKWTRVKEVFISRRSNRWGRKFGFVQFFELANVGRLEKDLNRIYIGNIKLYVNVPRYKRDDFEEVSVQTRVG